MIRTLLNANCIIIIRCRACSTEWAVDGTRQSLQNCAFKLASNNSTRLRWLWPMTNGGLDNGQWVGVRFHDNRALIDRVLRHRSMKILRSQRGDFLVRDRDRRTMQKALVKRLKYDKFWKLEIDLLAPWTTGQTDPNRTLCSVRILQNWPISASVSQILLMAGERPNQNNKIPNSRNKRNS